MTHVKVTKLTRLPDRPNGEFVGINEGGEISEGYWIKGYAFEMPKTGERFTVDRYERNGVKLLGQFSTSPVVAFDTKIGHIEIRTLNSTYQIDLLNP